MPNLTRDPLYPSLRIAAHGVFLFLLVMASSGALRQAAFLVLPGAYLWNGSMERHRGLANAIAAGSIVLLLVAAILIPKFDLLARAFGNYPWIFTAGPCLAMGSALLAKRLSGRFPSVSSVIGVLLGVAVMAAIVKGRNTISGQPALVEIPAVLVCSVLLGHMLCDASRRSRWIGGIAPAREYLGRIRRCLGELPAMAWLGIALAATLGIDAFASGGFLGSMDEGSCYAAAYHYLHATAIPWHYQNGQIYDFNGKYLFDLAGFRLALTLPATAVYWIFNERPEAVDVVFILYQLGLVTLTFLTAKRLWETSTAVLAAFLVAAWPLTFIYAPTPWPETPMAAWGLCSFYLLVRAFPFSVTERTPPLARRLLLCAAAGFALGAAFSAKESGLLPLVPLGLFVLFRAWRLHRWRAAAELTALSLGLVLLIVAETAFISPFFGHWTPKFAITSSGYSPPDIFRAPPESAPKATGPVNAPPPTGPTVPEYMPSLFEKIEVINDLYFTKHVEVIRGQLFQYFPVATLWLLGAAVLLIPFWGAQARWVWLLMLFPPAYLLFGSVSLKEYIPPPVHIRYFGMATGFWALGLAFALKRFVDDVLLGRVYAFAKPPRWLGGAVAGAGVAVLCALNLATGLNLSGVPYSGRQYASFIEALGFATQHYPDHTFVMSDLFGLIFSPVFLGNSREARYFRNPLDRSLPPIQGGPPFLLFAPLDSPTFYTGGLENVVRLEPGKAYATRILEVVQAQPNRAAEFWQALTAPLRVPDLPGARPPGLTPTALISVDKVPAPAAGRQVIFSSKTDKIPLVGQTPHKFEQIASGFRVFFGPDWPRSAVYSFFTPDTHSGPECILARFTPVLKTFTMHFKAQAASLEKKPAVTAALYLYRDGKLVWSGRKQASLDDGAAPGCAMRTPTAIEADAYRVVFEIADIAPAPGTLDIWDVEVTAD